MDDEDDTTPTRTTRAVPLVPWNCDLCMKIHVLTAMATVFSNPWPRPSHTAICDFLDTVAKPRLVDTLDEKKTCRMSHAINTTVQCHTGFDESSSSSVTASEMWEMKKKATAKIMINMCRKWNDVVDEMQIKSDSELLSFRTSDPNWLLYIRSELTTIHPIRSDSFWAPSLQIDIHRTRSFFRFIHLRVFGCDE